MKVRPSIAKRAREMALKQKRDDKAERRKERKLNRDQDDPEDDALKLDTAQDGSAVPAGEE